MTTVDIRGIIFDLDGVIANTAELHYESWKRLAEEVHVPFTRDNYHAMSGKKREENLRLFTEGLNLDDATKQAWFERKNGYFVEKMNHLQPEDAMPGIPRLIAQAKEAGIKLGVGSSSRNAFPVLERLQLTHNFLVIGDGSSVVNSKPAPDIFLWVAGGLGLHPRHILVIEDSPAGVAAARAGGFYVIGVGDAPFQGANAVVPDFGNYELSDVLALLG